MRFKTEFQAMLEFLVSVGVALSDVQHQRANELANCVLEPKIDRVG